MNLYFRRTNTFPITALAPDMPTPCTPSALTCLQGGAQRKLNAKKAGDKNTLERGKCLSPFHSEADLPWMAAPRTDLSPKETESQASQSPSIRIKTWSYCVFSTPLHHKLLLSNTNLSQHAGACTPRKWVAVLWCVETRVWWGSALANGTFSSANYNWQLLSTTRVSQHTPKEYARLDLHTKTKIRTNIPKAKWPSLAIPKQTNQSCSTVKWDLLHFLWPICTSTKNRSRKVILKWLTQLYIVIKLIWNSIPSMCCVFTCCAQLKTSAMNIFRFRNYLEMRHFFFWLK